MTLVNDFLVLVDRCLGTSEKFPAEPIRSECLAAPPANFRMTRRFLLGSGTATMMVAGGTALTEPSVASVAPVKEAKSGVEGMDHVRIAPSAAEIQDWSEFRNRFIQPDGRVIDNYNGGISHTESQGLGMLFAVAFNDRETFERAWKWTRMHLQRPQDALFSWKYVPDGTPPVPDVNNASDGDLYIATALMRASIRWGSDVHLQAARNIARDILTLLVKEIGGRTLLLPGVEGFITRDHAVINASYYAFPLIAELQAVFPSPLWSKLLDDGRKLVADARFGRWSLPSDWISVSARDGSLAPAGEKPPRFSFDAVRVPLFVAWHHGTTKELKNFTNFWGSSPINAPAWVDVETGVKAPFRACGGVVAIARIAEQGRRGLDQNELPHITPNDAYYSAALIMMSRLALRETTRSAA